MGATNRVFCSRCRRWVGGDCPHFRSADHALLAAAVAILQLSPRERTSNKWCLGPGFGEPEHPAFVGVNFEKGGHDVSYKIPLERGRIHVTGERTDEGIAYEIHRDSFDPDRLGVIDEVGHLADVAGGNLATAREGIRDAGGLGRVAPPLVVDPYARIDLSDEVAPGVPELSTPVLSPLVRFTGQWSNRAVESIVTPVLKGVVAPTLGAIVKPTLGAVLGPTLGAIGGGEDDAGKRPAVPME